MNTTTPLPRVTLYFKQGGSDKEYQAAIVSSGEGFLVNFAFGRRGTTLQTGTKTPQPVDLATAQMLYDTIVKEKTAKGYTPGESGTPYSASPKEDRITGILPQLLNSIDEAEALQLLNDPAWIAQEKLDGKRILIRKSGESITGINRKGLEVALPDPVIAHARQIENDWILDGEAIGDTFHAFDIVQRGTLRKRLDALYAMLPEDGQGPIRSVTTGYTTPAKTIMLANFRTDKAEGIVFKRLDGNYTPGRPHSGGPALKFKFVASASCIVAGPNGSKRSVYIDLLDNGARVNVGKVTIPGKLPIPPTGSIIEVRYLYAYKGGCLFQPVYLGVRDDVTIDACTLSQLKYKAGESDE